MNRNASGVAQSAATDRRVADDGDDDVLEPGVVHRAPEERQRVHLPDGGVDEVGLVPLPPRLVLLRAAVVVDGEQHPPARPGPRRRGRRPTCRSTTRPRGTARRPSTDAAASCSANPSSGGMNPRAASAAARSPAVHHQPSTWSTVSTGSRGAGLKSVPFVYATGISATWRHRVERDAEQLGRLLLVHQVQRRPRRAEPAGPGGEAEAPRRRDDRAEDCDARRHVGIPSTLALDARDQASTGHRPMTSAR